MALFHPHEMRSGLCCNHGDRPVHRPPDRLKRKRGIQTRLSRLSIALFSDTACHSSLSLSFLLLFLFLSCTFRSTFRRLLSIEPSAANNFRKAYSGLSSAR